MDATATILFIMLCAGAAGGFANWIVSPASETNPGFRMGLAGYALVGVAAAFVVPLFLSMAQSNLLSKAASQGAIDEKLIFAGFCIIAAFTSRNFMSSIAARLLQQVERAERTALNAEAKASEAKEVAIEAEDQTEELRDNLSNELRIDRTGEASLPEMISAQMTGAPGDLSDKEVRALRATGLMAMRTRTGIAKDADIPMSQISEVIETLANKQLIERTKSPRTSGLRFRLTDLGIQTLNSPPSDPRNEPPDAEH